MDDVERIALIEETVVPVVGDHGLELVDLDWRGLRPRGVLRLYVDKPGGVGVGDCARLSRELGDVLDAAAVIEGAYDLEVSSPGLDRQLKKDREYRWATGKQVRCWLAESREAVTLVGATLQILQAPLQEWAAEVALHHGAGSKKLIKHFRPPKLGME